MPFLSNSVFLQNMRMTDMILHELAIKTSCNFNLEKDNLKDISKDSMQCLVTHDKKEATDIEVKPKLEAEKIVNFIPYPDHNYGQQPPLTPPLENHKIVQVSEVIKETPTVKSEVIKETSSLKSEGNTDQEGVTKCICGFDHDDGYMICCDKCSAWQHIECMGIKSSKVPKKYSCFNCSPRELDIKRAKEIQIKKRENMSDDDDEEEDEVEESGSDEEASKSASYTIKYSHEVSNTPTRITLQLSNSNAPVPIIKKGKKGGRFGRKKTTEQRPSRRKTRRKDKSESLTQGEVEDIVLVTDAESFNAYLSSNASYERIGNNRCDEELKNMHFKLPEVAPSVDFQNIVKSYEIARDNKGLVASASIPSGNFIVEYVGTLMSLKKFDEQNPYFQHNLPYVIKYSKIEQFPVVIDARKHGNEARFLRRSCCANSELKHLTVNGSLHIMVMSVLEILKNQEITVPFDQDSENPSYIDCACEQVDCPLKTNINKETNLLVDPLKPPVAEGNQAMVRSDLNEHSHESESESFLGEDGKQEKLSREERKLQAYLKQFEKMEKKQDAAATKHKGKEINKTNLVRNTEEQSVNNVLGTKPTLVKKLSGKRKSANVSGKRRTRQSSCSSEPVSPAEQEHNSAASTPNSSLVVSTCSTTETIFSRQRSKKEKEPLTLTLPIQRKIRNENSLSSPTPPYTPSIEVSPASDHTNLSLTVDTQLSLALDSTPMKSNNLGLLQIARHSNGYPLQNCLSTLAHPTSEEKIGNLLLRNSGQEHVSFPSPYARLPHTNKQNRKYFGSLKKHWLRKHVLEKNANSQQQQQQQQLYEQQQLHQLPLNGDSDQICLAALMATFDPRKQQQNVENSSRVFKRTKNFVPLKKRHIRRAMQKIEIQNKLVEESNSQLEQLQNRLQQTTAKTYSKSSVSESSTVSKNVLSLPMETNNEAIDKLEKTKAPVDESFIETKSDNPLSISETMTSRTNETTLDISEQKRDITENTNNALTENESSNTQIHTDSLNTQAGSKRTLTESLIDAKQPDVKKAKISPASPAANSIPTIAVKEESVTVTSIKHAKLPETVKMDTASTIDNKQILYEPKCESTDVAHNTESTRGADVLHGIDIAHSIGTNKVRTYSNSSSLASPRTSIDSNPELEQASGIEGNPATVKRKLSIKDYRNRRSQKSVTVTTSTLENHVTSTTLSIINKAADTLLTPKTLSLCGPQSSSYTTPSGSEQATLESNTKKRAVLNTIELSKKTDNINITSDSNIPSGQKPVTRNTYDTANGPTTLSNNDENMVMKKQDVVQQQSTAKHRIGTTTNVFEPVSPISDEASKDEQPNTSGTIHSDITKNPFTIHNKITKHPFTKKQTQGPGLLQYLSAQKYPHLASITNSSNNSSSTNAISPNPEYHRSPHQHNTEYHNMLHDNVATGENDEDTSSNHSSISSTSFGSGDMLHDRSHSNYHRSSTTPSSGGGVHPRDTYVGRDVRDYYSHNNYGSTTYYPSYQAFNQQQPQQQQHPQNNRQPNATKRNHPGFIQPPSTNAYTPQASQALRRLQPHNRFHHY